MITWLKQKLGLGLTFKQAWGLAVKGRNIRRDAWVKNCSVFLPLRACSCSFARLECWSRRDGVIDWKFWQPYAADFTATDWRVL
jgi:hypothetical protein